MKKLFSLVLVLALMFSAVPAFASEIPTVEVEEGDTLAKLAEEYGITVDELVMYNTITDPNMIYVGQKLMLGQEFSRKDVNDEYIMALAWVQDSAEFAALSHQAYNMARMAIDLDLATMEEGAKKGAVIVDVDETVLDNSYYNASFTGNNGSYGSSTWNEWVKDEKATAMPGSIEFLNYAVEKGYDIYYVTNRKAKYDLTEPTMNNLKALGYPQATEDHMLLRTDESDKEARRQIVAEDHRIVLLMGDNLNDFTSDFGGLSNDARKAEVEKVKAEFGKKFIILPNPIYGDWEPGMADGYWGLDDMGKSKARQDVLKRWEQ